MNVDVHDSEGRPHRPRWPVAPTLARRRPEAAPIYTYLLDADDDLAAEFDQRTRHVARQGTTVRVLEAEAGECDLTPAFTAVGSGAGLLLLDGMIVLETSVADRTGCELLGAGDLLQPPARREDELIDLARVWRVLRPVRLALLDSDFSERTRSWPQLPAALIRRADRRIANADAMRAITCHPRLEVRLVLVFWHLAARWGRVEPHGIRLILPITHRLLGQLVGAERPSISHALARLAQAEMVTGTTGDLHLHGTVEDQLEALSDRGLASREQGSRLDERSTG